MTRILTYHSFNATSRYIEAFGLSTDNKPTAGIVTGSKYTEVDTGDVYLFDETDTGTWYKVAQGYRTPEETPTAPEETPPADDNG